MLLRGEHPVPCVSWGREAPSSPLGWQEQVEALWLLDLLQRALGVWGFGALLPVWAVIPSLCAAGGLDRSILLS